MKNNLLRFLGILLMAVIFGGGALFAFAVFGLLMDIKLYIYYAVLAVGAAGLLALVLVTSGFFAKKVKRCIGLCLLVVCLAAAGYVGHGVWRDSLPTLSDRDILLHQYEPFTENNKLASLSEPSDLQLTGYLPRVDGATALYPVYAAFVQAVYPGGEYPLYGDSKDGYAAVSCSGTIEAYARLIDGETDLVFAAAPSQEQLDMAEKAGMELHMTPIGREAFVFFVNSENPVSGLTVEEIQGIYSGKITNWKTLGGQNRSIRPFQRAENSGSQSALLRLMGDVPLMEPATEERIGAMDGIIRSGADYRNYDNAIGFSFLYYATEMVSNQDIKLLALNGITPTRETISDGSYPMASTFFAVTASPIGQPAPEENSENLSKLLAWILSPQGQQLIERTGYVALQ